MQVIVDSLGTTYDDIGKGKLILLLHGWGDTKASFAKLRAALSQQYRVIALDLPGFGETEAPKAVWNLDDYGHFVKQFLTKLKLDQPYAVVGHSNGSALAIRSVSLGLIQPDRLVLLSAAGIRTAQKGKRLVLKVIAKTGKVATIWLPESQRRKLRQKLYGVAGSDMLVAPHLQETFKKTVKQDIQADARKITIPTLLVYGEDDRATPPTYGELFHQLIDGSTLELIGSAGHFVHQDQPEKVNALIEDFLR